MIVPTMPSVRAPRWYSSDSFDLAVARGGDLALDHRAEPAVGGDEVGAEQAADHEDDQQIVPLSQKSPSSQSPSATW